MFSCVDLLESNILLEINILLGSIKEFFFNSFVKLTTECFERFLELSILMQSFRATTIVVNEQKVFQFYL